MPKILLDELVESVTRGAQIKADDLDRMMSRSEGHSSTRYLAQSGIEQGMILYSKLPYIDLFDNVVNDKYYLIPRDIIIAKGSMNTKTAIATEDPGNVLVGGSLFIVRVNPQKIDPLYLCAFLQSEEGQKQLRLACKGTTRANNISSSDIRNMWVYVPSVRIQQDIAEKFRESEETFYKSMEIKRDIQNYFDANRDYRA